MLNSVVSGAFCFRAPLDFSIFYFWWFLRESRVGGAQRDGRAPFGQEKKNGVVLGAGFGDFGGGYITQTKPGNTPTCNKNQTAGPSCFNVFSVFYVEK